MLFMLAIANDRSVVFIDYNHGNIISKRTMITKVYMYINSHNY